MKMKMLLDVVVVIVFVLRKDHLHSLYHNNITYYEGDLFNNLSYTLSSHCQHYILHCFFFIFNIRDCSFHNAKAILLDLDEIQCYPWFGNDQSDFESNILLNCYTFRYNYKAFRGRFFSFEKSCSRYDNEIFCLNDISTKLTGFPFWYMARSAMAITAYLPFVVSFIFSYIYSTYLVIPSKTVNFNNK